jgi:hypothetical protein
MLSVIVVNYKNPALLRLCLSSLVRTLPAHIPHEVIVVDSASTVETRSVVREEFGSAFSSVHLVAIKENTGYTRGVNLGILASHGEQLLILNPDIIPTDGSIERMVNYACQHPDIGLMGPKLLNFNGTRQESCFRFYTLATIISRRISHLPFVRKELARFVMRDHAFSTPTDVDWLMGSAMLVSRQALKRVGSMDERFFHYFNDVDWARQFWENGYRVVYYPDTSFYHYHQRGSKRWFWFLDALFNREARWHIRDGIRYLRKYGIRTPRFTP